MIKFPKILFFIKDTMPTQGEIEASEECGLNVSFRNASMVPADGCLEQCAGVAGAVPARYAKAFPPAQEAIELFMQARRKALKPASEDSAEPDEPIQAPATKEPEKKPKQGKEPVWEPNK